MKTPKVTAKKLVAKATARKKANAKELPSRQMTVALAEKRALKMRPGYEVDIVEFLRTLR